MKIKIETGYFETPKQMKEFLEDVRVLLDAFENLSRYTHLEFVIETTKLVIE